MLSMTKYRRDIQALRGLAVLAVVLFHARESYFPLGYLGVDVFFVISGFVITPLILRIFTDQVNGGGYLSNLRYFYKSRFYRLAPALAVTLTISVLLISLLGPIADHQRFARQGMATVLLVGNVGAYKYSGDYFSPNPNPLIHTWSLSVEEQIYLILPLILLLLFRNFRRFKKVYLVALGLISVTSFTSFLFPTILQPVYSKVGIELSSQFSFYSPIDRIWQFTLGSLGFLLLGRYQNPLKKFSKGIDLLLVIVVLIILFGPVNMSLKVGSIFASLFAVIVILSKSLDVLPDFLIKKLEWVGDRSYSIYLVHMPLLYLANYSRATQIGSRENRMIQTTIAVIASILLGALSYSKIESRFRNKGKSNTTRSKSISVAMVLTLVIPFLLFTLMDIGQKVQYWGLDRNLPKPVVAWELDPNCNRMSERYRPCIYEKSVSKQTVLLVGDSHAAHISQAVVDAAKKEDWNAAIWTQAGCHVQFQRSKKDQMSDQCMRQNQRILKWVKGNKPRVVIVSQFVSASSSQADLRNALSTLQLIVPNVLLIENNPVFPDEKDFMVWRPLIMSPYKPPMKFAQSMMETNDKKASNELASYARNNGISTMNFNSLFCKKDVCMRFSNKQWLYYDDDHFSAAGAELTIPQLAAFLQQF
ncbi:unannotated protein [freshwater metagenome]|uniref:Unannotated protein n=1 Tax=freshwater metagenome TaxID=449393 RepID=A0A6J6ERQ8_9ZZZZ